MVTTLTPRLHDVLKAIHDYIEEFGKPPYRDNKWISERTGYESNHITNIKSELRKYKLLTEDVTLTSRGQDYIRFYFGAFSVQGIELRVQGTVKAGPGSEVYANYDNFDIPSEETVFLPSVSPDKDCFALKVSGSSMTELGILNGDYVIVEKQDSLWWPEPQDLIIARYLPHDPMKDSDESYDYEDYVGPTIKVYIKRFDEKGCELGWRGDNDKNPYVIQADHLIPIAKVIGVYRSIDTILPSSFQ